jgi:hypothetical protein
MKGIRGYWDARLERWAYWASGARSVKVATFSTLRVDNGTRGGSGEPYEPDSERETELLLAHLPAWERELLCTLYPRSHGDVARLAGEQRVSVSAVYSSVRRCHGDLQRLLDKRRRGEPLTLERPPKRARAIRTQFASAVPH